MEFGFSCTPSGIFEESVELIQLAEKLGYSRAWVADQTFYHDPYLILSAAALSTTHIKLGIGVTNPYTRHPAMTARAAATLDEISSGRFALGIGAGNQRELIGALGIRAEAPARACRESVQILRALWAGQLVKYEGKDFHLAGVELEFAARPDIPIFIGGRGPQILSMAGREADGAILSQAGLDRAWKYVANAAEHVGRNPDEIFRVAWVKCALLDAGADVERYRVRVAHVLGRAPEKGLLTMGLSEDEIRKIKDAYEKGGPVVTATQISDQMLKNHVIFGTAKECVTSIAAFATNGIDEFVFQTIGKDFEEKRKSLDIFAKEIISQLKV